MEPEEEIEPTQEYVDAFNNGYIISQYLPELADSISKSTGDLDSLNGVKDGRQQYLTEEYDNLKPDWLKPKSNSKENISKSKDIEPEI